MLTQTRHPGSNTSYQHVGHNPDHRAGNARIQKFTITGIAHEYRHHQLSKDIAAAGKKQLFQSRHGESRRLLGN
jgi:hypothetical protein